MRKGNYPSEGRRKRSLSRSSGSRKKVLTRTHSSKNKKSEPGDDFPEKQSSTKSSRGNFSKRSLSNESESKGSFKKSYSNKNQSEKSDSERKTFTRSNTSERSGLKDRSKGNFSTRKSTAESGGKGTFKESYSRKYRSDEGRPERKTFKGNNKFEKRESESRRKEDNTFPNRLKGKFSKRRSPTEQEGKGAFKKTRSTKYHSDNARPSFVKKNYSIQKSSDTRETTESSSGKIRLNKFISNSGVCSRREADNLIQMGLISVNGKVVTELGFKVNLTDDVRYENKVLKAEKPVYILLNKPKGYLTTTNDPQERDTVMHLIGNAVKERVYPVGRLDRNTTGLLLLTNDGDLADKLSHPSYNVKKIYKVELSRALSKSDFQKIQEGVRLEEGKALVDDIAVISDDGKTIGLELHIGWNRVVRRIFEALEYEVIKLDRSVYAGLDKKELPRGKWRFLKKEEVVKLKHFQ